MQTQTVNTALCRWLDEKCQQIEQATDGRQRYQAFAAAMRGLYDDAPVTVHFSENGFRRDNAELVMALQALCWCALSAGVKTETAKKAFEAWQVVIPIDCRN
jgi:hypothetical protein